MATVEPEPEPQQPAPEEIFAVDAVCACLAGGNLPREVGVLEVFPSVSAVVARLQLSFRDGSSSTVVAKGATAAWNHGAGLRAVRRELRVLRDIAPLWPCPCPRLLGALDDDDGLALFLSADLGGPYISGVSPYTTPGNSVTAAQLEGAVDCLIAQHAAFW